MRIVLTLIAAVSLFTATAFGQDEPARKEDKSSRLIIIGDVQLSRDIARDISLLQELHGQKNWEQLVKLYGELLNKASGKLIKRSDSVYVNAGDFLREEMAKLGPRAREIYRIQYDRAAERVFNAAAREVNEKKLETVLRYYMLSSYADDALSLLAAIDAERAEFSNAAWRLQKLLSWFPDTDLDRKMILVRAAWYNYYAGRFKLAKKCLTELGADDGIKVEDAARYKLSELGNLIAKNSPSSVAGTAQGCSYVSGIPGGGFSRAGNFEDVASSGKVVWQGYMFGTQNARNALRQSSHQNSKRRRPLSPGNDDFRYQSTEYGGMLYTGTEVGVNVFNMRTGRLVMELVPPNGGEYFPGLESYLAPTVTEECVFTNFVYEVSDSENVQGILIKAAMPRYTLCAYDRSTGKLKWAAHKDRELKRYFAGKWFSMPSAPVLTEGVVIVEIRTRGMLAGSYLAAFDSDTGSMKWVKPLCSNGRELTMFGYEARGPLSTMLACSENGRPTVYCCTNLGALFALDARTGEIQWAAVYDQIKLQAAELYRAQMRNVVWLNSPPIVVDGVLVVAPLDSEYVYAFDAKTGKMLWRYSHSWQNSQFRYVLGVADGKVILDGARLAGIELQTGKVKWLSERTRIKNTGGRGVLTPTQAVLPRPDGIYRYSVQSGKLIRSESWAVTGSRSEPGNLLAADDRLVVTGLTKVTSYKKLVEK